jgi:hypothetical protein
MTAPRRTKAELLSENESLRAQLAAMTPPLLDALSYLAQERPLVHAASAAGQLAA